MTGFIKKIGLILTTILVCLLGTLLPAATVSADITQPEEFYGALTINGVAAPAGTVIIAKIGGIERGSFTTTEAGKYGGSGTFDSRLVVAGEEADIGRQITFWVRGSEADQTAIYEPGNSQELNLTAWVYPLQATDAQIDDALYYLRLTQAQQSSPNGRIGGFDVDAWVVMAIAAAGQDPNTWTAGGKSIVDYLREHQEELADDENPVAGYGKLILAIVAAGKNPRDFGGINYVNKVTAAYNNSQVGADTLLNDDFWGLIGLSAIGESDAIQGSKDFIISNQNDDGGWNWAVDGDSDADNTAAAISALVAAGENPSSAIIANALDYLESQQQNNGGFSYADSTNSASTSWAINAIADVGQSPVGSVWQKSGNNPLEYLLSLQNTDGSFRFTTSTQSQPVWMTAYAVLALMGGSWPKDNTPPVISGLTPSSGASTSDTTPTISATFTDATSAIDTSSVQMKLDGTNVTSSATVTTSGISYTASSLALGTHSVSVTISDKRGNEASQSWSFKVISSDSDDDDDGGGGGGGGGGGTPGYTYVTEYVTSTGRFTKKVIAKSEDDKVELDISKDTIGKNRVGQPLRYITITKMKNPPDPPSQSSFIALAYDLGPDGATFEPPISLTLSYDPAEIPTGVAEENLVIAVWNEADDIWEDLPSKVDPADNIVTASFSHFTTFTILAHTRPADFTLSDLSITPAEVNIGDRIEVSVLVTNTGDLKGTYEVSLELDGDVVRTKEITLAGDDSDSVSFSITKDAAGEYKVKVGDLAGTFKVKPQLSPDKFNISNLSISPSLVQSGESVTITAFVGNTGKLAGTCKVTLKIDNIAVETKKVKVAGGASQKVTFVTTKEAAGSYSVAINGLSGTFTVTEKAPSPATTPASPKSPAETPKVAPPPSTTPINWPIIGIVIAAVLVVGLVIFLVFRRSTY